ncbi:MAG TPA: hypothetical protein VHF47_01835 [Acidimicrobiales bacterium]|nr:hypothetical protein [Acidimicrobiales bacterium]
MAPVEGAQAQVGRPAGHEGQPREQEVGGPVDNGGGRAADDARGQARRHPPHHQPPGGRGGEDVGRHRDHRDAAEHGHQHGGHTGLGGDRGRQRQRQPAARQRARQDGDAHAGGHGQPEAEGADQQWIDQQRAGDGQREGAKGGGRTADRCGPHHDRRHGDGPHDGRLPPGEHAEEGEKGQRGDQSQAQPEERQRRRRHGKDEGDVLARHGEQVGEARVAEGGAQLVGLLSIVTEDDAGEQCPSLGRERSHAVEQRATDGVGRAGDERPTVEALGRHHVEAGSHVAHGQVRRPPPRDRSALAGHADPLARQAVAQDGGG